MKFLFRLICQAPAATQALVTTVSVPHPHLHAMTYGP